MYLYSYFKLINHVVEIDEINISFKRKIIILIFQFDDFIKTIYSYFDLLKFIIKNMIRYLIIYIFKFSKLSRFLITSRNSRVKIRFNSLKFELIAS